MDAIHITNKSRMLDALEKFYIYRETQLGNQINDKLTVQHNPIFEALLRNAPYRGAARTRTRTRARTLTDINVTVILTSSTAHSVPPYVKLEPVVLIKRSAFCINQ
jgi:hypothetical protein